MSGRTYSVALDEQAEVARLLNLWWAPMIRDGDELLASDAYFVTEEFERLVVSAAATVPVADRLHHSDFPASCGWVSMESVRNDRPLWADRELQYVGVAWQVKNTGCHVTLWAYHKPGEITPWLMRLSGEAGDCPLCMAYDGDPSNLRSEGSAVGWDDAVEEVESGIGKMRASADVINRWWAAFWLLIGQQSVAENTEEQVPRAWKRRAERNGQSPTVRVVRLPRRVREASGEHHEVDWQHRWIVSGHWRRQPWGPERKRIRPVWIAPYVKGPDDKPLKAQAQRLFVASAPEEARG